MTFKEKYTTTRLKSEDKEKKEEKKIEVSEESFLNAEMIENLTKTIARKK